MESLVALACDHFSPPSAHCQDDDAFWSPHQETSTSREERERERLTHTPA